MKTHDGTTLDRLFPDFSDEFEKALEFSLASGAISKATMENSPYFVYRAVLLIVAERYGPDTPKAKEVHRNLKSFI